ncbi:MAG: hypothetical protein HUK20_03840 [Fibrobacter sp.]|nr:hypothetical protein [Fibrobacter sp.]
MRFRILKTGLGALIGIFLSISVGCSGTKPIRVEMEQVSCSPTALRGFGFSVNSVDAKNEAFNQIATQIKSSVEFSSHSSKVVTNAGGVENIESTYLMENAAKASISNAENVQVIYTRSSPEGTGVVACMERSAAAQPFLNLYESTRDSFEMAKAQVIGAKHPKKKLESFKMAQNLYNKMVRSGEVVASLGQQTYRMIEEQERFKESRENLVQHVQQFRKNYSVTIAEDIATVDKSMSGLVRETLLNTNKFDGADRSRGVRVLVSAGKMKCDDGIFGFVCESGVVVRITSLSGEVYVEYSESLKSTSSTSKDDAAKRITKLINKDNEFIQKVHQELSNWIL